MIKPYFTYLFAFAYILIFQGCGKELPQASFPEPQPTAKQEQNREEEHEENKNTPIENSNGVQSHAPQEPQQTGDELTPQPEETIVNKNELVKTPQSPVKEEEEIEEEKTNEKEEEESDCSEHDDVIPSLADFSSINLNQRRVPKKRSSIVNSDLHIRRYMLARAISKGERWFIHKLKAEASNMQKNRYHNLDVENNRPMIVSLYKSKNKKNNKEGYKANVYTSTDAQYAKEMQNFIEQSGAEQEVFINLSVIKVIAIRCETRTIYNIRVTMQGGIHLINFFEAEEEKAKAKTQSAILQ